VAGLGVEMGLVVLINRAVKRGRWWQARLGRFPSRFLVEVSLSTGVWLPHAGVAASGAPAATAATEWNTGLPGIDSCHRPGGLRRPSRSPGGILIHSCRATTAPMLARLIGTIWHGTVIPHQNPSAALDGSQPPPTIPATPTPQPQPTTPACGPGRSSTTPNQHSSRSPSHINRTSANPAAEVVPPAPLVSFPIPIPILVIIPVCIEIPPHPRPATSAGQKTGLGGSTPFPRKKRKKQTHKTEPKETKRLTLPHHLAFHHTKAPTSPYGPIAPPPRNPRSTITTTNNNSNKSPATGSSGIRPAREVPNPYATAATAAALLLLPPSAARDEDVARTGTGTETNAAGDGDGNGGCDP
jgi:hypothetical protein